MVYEYEILGTDGAAKGIYEAEQRMSDPPLTHHPETGEPLRRILSATFAGNSTGSFTSSAGDCSTGTCGVPSYGGCAGGMCGLN